MTYTIEQYQNREEYARSIFKAILEVAKDGGRQEAVKLAAIKNMAEIGADGVVLVDADDFSGENVTQMLREAETELSSVVTGQPEAKALMQIQLTVTRLEALLQSVSASLHNASEGQVGDAATLAGWGAEIAGGIANDLDIYDMQRSKGKPVY